MLTNSGGRVDLPEPAPEQILIQDIAHHLSYINRFTGATTSPYSVASHSLYVSRLLAHLGPEMELAGLMHDAPEAYLGDVSSPLKRLLPEYKRIEANFWRVIAEKWGLPKTLPAEVHEADRNAYFAERTVLMPWNADLLEEGEGLERPPTISIFQGPENAKAAFIQRFHSLRRQIDENNYKRELPGIRQPYQMALVQ